MPGDTIDAKILRHVSDISGLTASMDRISQERREAAIKNTAWCNRDRLQDSAIARILHKTEITTSVLNIGFGAISGLLNITKTVFTAARVAHPVINVLNSVIPGFNLMASISPMIHMGADFSSRMINEKKREQNAINSRKVITRETQMNNTMEKMRNLEADIVTSMRSACAHFIRSMQTILQAPN